MLPEETQQNNNPAEKNGSESKTGSTPASPYVGLYDPQREIQRVEKDIERVNYFFIGLVVFVAVTFLIEIYTMNLDRIKDKDLYLIYNDLYQQYSEKNSQMKDEISKQKIEFEDLKNQFEMLKARNSFLK